MSSWRWRAGGVADAHRPRAHVAGQVVERLLGELVAPVDPVHDLERAVRVELGAARLDPAHERAGFLGVAQAHEAVEGERPVADPGVAIVPVARPADLLGQTEGGGCDDRPVPARGEQLEQQRRPVDHFAPAPPVGRAREPVAPEVMGRLERPHRVGGIGADASVAGGILEDEGGSVPGAQHEFRRRRPVLQVERDRSAQPQCTAILPRR